MPLGGHPPAGRAPSPRRTVCRGDTRATAGKGFAGPQRLGPGPARPDSLSARGQILILSALVAVPLLAGSR